MSNLRPKFIRNHHHHHKKDKIMDPELEEASKLASLILVAGDKPNLAVDLISDIATVIVRDFDRFKDTVILTFAGCTAEYAHKPHVYAALLTAVAKLDLPSATMILDSVHHHLTSALSADRVAQIRSISRFLSILTDLGTLQTDTFVSGYLLPLANSLTVQNNRSDVYVTVLCSAIMFAPTSLAPYRTQLLGPVVEYVNLRSSNASRVAALNAVRPLNPDAAAFLQNDALHDYVKQVTAMFPLDGLVPATPIPLAQWVSKFMYTNHVDTEGASPALSTNDMDTDVTSLQPLSFTSVDLQAAATDIMHFDAPPMVSFRVFNDNMTTVPGFPPSHPFSEAVFVPNVPHTGAIERLVCTDIVTDQLLNIQYNHKAGVRTLLDLKLMFAQGTFEYDANEVQLVNADQGTHPTEPMFNYEMLVIELVVCALVRLPAPQVRPIFYTNIIMGLCRISPKRVAHAFAKALHTMFGRLEDLDLECLVRLVDLFSHHLSNFGYAWKWDDWAFVLAANLSENTDKLVVSKRWMFIRAVLERITRLAYFDRIKSSLPDTCTAMFESMKPSTIAKYKSQEYQALGELVHEAISNHQSASEVMALGTAVLLQHPEGEEQETANKQPQVYQSILIAILTYGDTMSHTLSVLDKYMPLVQQLAPKENVVARVDVVRVAYQVYQHNQQFFTIVLDKLLAARTCLPAHVLAWLTSALIPDPNTALDMDVVSDLPNTQSCFPDQGIMSPMFVLEILVLLVKKALHRVDALELKVQDPGFLATASEELQAIVKTNIEKAHVEKNEVFMQITHLLLTQACVGSVDHLQINHWSCWPIGSLLTLYRMYMADMDTDIRQQLVQYVQDHAPNEYSKTSLLAVFALE